MLCKYCHIYAKEKGKCSRRLKPSDDKYTLTSPTEYEKGVYRFSGCNISKKDYMCELLDLYPNKKASVIKAMTEKAYEESKSHTTNNAKSTTTSS